VLGCRIKVNFAHPALSFSHFFLFFRCCFLLLLFLCFHCARAASEMGFIIIIIIIFYTLNIVSIKSENFISFFIRANRDVVYHSVLVESPGQL